MAQDNPILNQASSSDAAGDNELSLVDVIKTSLTEAATAVQETKAKIQEGKNKVAALGSSIVDSITSQGQAQQTMALAKDTADMQAQQTANDILGASGGTEYQVQLMTELKDDGQNLANLRDKHADIMDDEITGLFIIDNAINKVRAKPTDLAITEAENQYNGTVTQIQNINSAQESFYQTNQHAKQTITNASIAANQTAISEQYKQMADKQAIANVQTNADMMTAMTNADSKITDMMLKEYQLDTSEESRELTKQRLEMQKIEMERSDKRWEMELPRLEQQMELTALQLKEAKDPQRIAVVSAQREKILADMETAKQVRQQNIVAVQRAQSMLYGPNGVESPELIATNIDNVATRGQYQDLRLAGSQQRPVMGTTPSEARAFLTKYDPDGLAIVTPAMKILKQASAAQAGHYATSTTGVPKDQAVSDRDFNSQVKAEMTAAASDIKAKDYSNPYQAPSLPTLEMNANLQQTKLYQEVLAPAGVKEIVPQNIVDMANNAVIAKTLTPEEAADGIVQLFNAVAGYNNTNQGGFERTGMAEYNQTSYNTYIERPLTSYEQLNKSVNIAASAAGGVTSVLSMVAGVQDTRKNLPLPGATKLEKINLMDRAQVTNLMVQLRSAQPTEKDIAATQTAVQNTGE